MAVGSTVGGFATVSAPNVDIGAMTERFVDKELARDATRKKEVEAQKQAKAKAKADAEKLRSGELNDEWAEAKATGRSMYDISATKFIYGEKDKAAEARKKYVTTGDVRYKQEYDRSMDRVKTLANASTQISELLVRVGENLDNDVYNEDLMEDWDGIATAINEGKYSLTVDKDGNTMATFFDTDPNDNINDSRTLSFSDILKEPLKKPKYDKLKTTFVDKHKPDTEVDVTELRTTTTKPVTERLEQQINSFADRISKSKSEFAAWYINKNGKDEYLKNQGNFSDEDFTSFKNYIVEDIKGAYPEFEKIDFRKPRASKGGDDIQLTGDIPFSTSDRVLSYGGYTISKGASTYAPATAKGGAITLTGGKGETLATLDNIFYDANGLKMVVSEIYKGNKSTGTTMTGTTEDGAKVTMKIGENDSGQKVVTRVLVGDIGEGGNPEMIKWMSRLPGKGSGVKSSLFNNYVKSIKNIHGLDNLTNKEVIIWAKKNLNEKGEVKGVKKPKQQTTTQEIDDNL